MDSEEPLRHVVGWPPGMRSGRPRGRGAAAGGVVGVPAGSTGRRVMSAQGDCEFLVQRARELVPQDLWAAKAWLITARSLYPADFNIQVSLARQCARAEGSV